MFRVSSTHLQEDIVVHEQRMVPSLSIRVLVSCWYAAIGRTDSVSSPYSCVSTGHQDSYREWRYHMLLVYNYVLLKMSTWYSKHVEESNNILRINNIQCITLVILYGQWTFYINTIFLIVLYIISSLYDRQDVQHFKHSSTNRKPNVVFRVAWILFFFFCKILSHNSAHFSISHLSKFKVPVFYNIIYNKPTRCNSGNIVFIKNYKYALHVSDALCFHLQEHYKL